MSYTATQLRTMYSAVHIGLAPDQATGAALDTVAGESLAGLRTDASAKAFVINGADKDTAVAALSYEFYTGAAPSAAGMAYLVNSSANATDLNDPYYAGFNLENRYINFATNLGVVGEGAAGFAGAYGSLTFSQAVDLAYEKIIGTTYAQAAGLNSAAARADITGREAYFTALANQNFASGSVAQRDLAAKAGVVGYILAEAMKADVGVYAAAMNNYSAALIDGTAVYGQDLLVAYPSTPTPTPTPVTDPTATPPSGPGAIITNLPAGNNIFVAGAGDNTITSGGGDNTITAGGGNDIITAGAGNDTINAGDGTNIVTTGAGNDTVTTGTGNDIIIMGPNLSSLDTVSGGAGTDILKVSGTLAGVAFANVTGIEILDLTGAADVTLGAQGMTAGITSVTNSGGGGVIVDASAYTISIAITGGAGADVLTGGTGADVLTGGAGVDTLNGGTGSDRFVFSDVDADTNALPTGATDIVGSGFVSGADKLDFTIAGTVGNFQKVLPVSASLTAFIAAADTALDGTVHYYFGVVGADGYLAMDTNGIGITAIIKMVGVVDMTFGDIV